MKTGILHVITAEISSAKDAENALRMLRRASGTRCTDSRALLLFCDLADSCAQKRPDDEPVIRMLQSSVMSMNMRRSGRFFLLVRSRKWDDALRLYAGSKQHPSVHRVMLELIETGKTQTRFEAATISPALLRACCSAILFSFVSLACTPDTPARMLDALENTPCGGVCAHALHRHVYPDSVLDRLMRAGFSLMPFEDVRQAAALRSGFGDPYGPAMYTPEGLRRMLGDPSSPIPLLENCLFVHEAPASMHAVFSSFRVHCLCQSAAHAAVPVMQFLLLFTAALLGLPALAAAAILIPEIGSLRFASRLPSALVRLALLPLCAFVAADALLMRAQAQSNRLRLIVPHALFSAQSAAACGALLLLSAFRGTSALAALLPVCLLWLAAPLLIPALQAPTIERIPLSEDQSAKLRSEAESAFFDCIAHSPPNNAPALHMLAACAGGLLGLLEPDEAGRRMGRLMDMRPLLSTPADCAAMLASAQYLREHMSACDAALRALPRQIEDYVLSQPLSNSTGTLSMFLAQAQNTISTHLPHGLAKTNADVPEDLLFLPLTSPSDRQNIVLDALALTHPHTYLRRLSDGHGCKHSDALRRFLFLAAASLSHPFHALLMRSPLCAPYASLWAI